MFYHPIHLFALLDIDKFCFLVFWNNSLHAHLKQTIFQFRTFDLNIICNGKWFREHSLWDASVYDVTIFIFGLFLFFGFDCEYVFFVLYLDVFLVESCKCKFNVVGIFTSFYYVVWWEVTIVPLKKLSSIICSKWSNILSNPTVIGLKLLKIDRLFFMCFPPKLAS